MYDSESDNSLSGLQILIVEDEGAIALLLEDMLMDLGCEIAGTAARVSKAMELINGTAKIDIALLDLNIAGESAYPLAEELMRKSIRFLFSTGYGDVGLKNEFSHAPVLQKPFTQRDLKARLLELVKPA
jgi:FOG: CheY-like receiver